MISEDYNNICIDNILGEFAENVLFDMFDEEQVLDIALAICLSINQPLNLKK